MNRLKSKNGLTWVIAIFFLIALALVLVIVIPIIRSETNEDLNAMDQKYVVTAEKEASVRFIQDTKPFSEVYDTETKKFYSKSDARIKVTPYGSSKEHKGKYVLVTVDGNGNITSEWIAP